MGNVAFQEALHLLACPRCGGALRSSALACTACGAGYEIRGGIPDLRLPADRRGAFAAIARLVRPGGILVVGLYNAYARLPHRVRRAVARLSGFRWIPLDPVLRERRAEPARREAWLRDQYRHVEEHRHTLGEVQGWFRENRVEYVRAFPDTLLASDPPRGGDLFRAAEDDWAFENVLAQLGWARTLSHEGGLFVVVGRAAAR